MKSHPNPFRFLRKTLLAALLLPAVCSPVFLHSQITTSPTTEDYALLAEDDLDQLLGPIALYPDALVGLILPASTVPIDVTLATRYLDQGDLDLVDDQPWDDSVISLTRYPDVLAWMDENLEWTSALGEAFYAQPDDVMRSIQRLRQEAQTAGNLVNTPQQTVLVQEVSNDQEVYAPNDYSADYYEPYEPSIRIVPTNPEVIYVPVYDPQVVYEPSVVYIEDRQPNYVSNVISFGAGFAVGAWLDYAFDWNRQELYYGDNCGYNDRDYWYDRGSYDQGRNVNIVETNTNISNVNNITNVDNRNFNTWEPSAAGQRQINQRQRNNGGNARYASARTNDNRKPNKNATAPNKRKQSAVPKPNRIKADGKRRAAGPQKNKGQANKNGKANQKGSKANASNRPGSKNKQKASDRAKQPKKPSKAPQVAGGNKKSKNDKKPNASQKQKASQQKDKSPKNKSKQANRNKPSNQANGQKGKAKQANRTPKPTNQPKVSKNGKSQPSKNKNAGQKSNNSNKKKNPTASRPQAKKPSKGNQAKQQPKQQKKRPPTVQKQRQPQPKAQSQKKRQPQVQQQRQRQPQAQKQRQQQPKARPQQRPKQQPKARPQPRQQKAQPQQRQQRPQQARPQQQRQRNQQPQRAKSQPKQKSNPQRAQQNQRRNNSSAELEARKNNKKKKKN